MVLVQLERHPGMRFLVTLAAAMIVVQGMNVAEPVLLPFALASFVAVICLPLVFWLNKLRVPLPLATLVTVLLTAGAFVFLIVVGSQQLRALQEQVPALVGAVFPHVGDWLARLEVWLPVVEEGELRSTFFGLFNAGAVASLATGATTWALSFLSNTFLVFLILAFALAETPSFVEKLEAIGVDGAPARYRDIVGEVQGYLVIKTLISLATGILAGLVCWLMGLELPILLGLVAFGLNYVPTIGSIIAAIPAVGLALVQIDPAAAVPAALNFEHAAYVGLGYMAINVTLGNWLEPTLLGRRLGISTLVVILSLVFWGWLWGPVGALLSVPLTMVVKIMLENTQDLRWVAVLIGKKVEDEDEKGGQAASGAADVEPAAAGAGSDAGATGS